MSGVELAVVQQQIDTALEGLEHFHWQLEEIAGKYVLCFQIKGLLDKEDQVLSTIKAYSLLIQAYEAHSQKRVHVILEFSQLRLKGFSNQSIKEMLQLQKYVHGVQIVIFSRRRAGIFRALAQSVTRIEGMHVVLIDIDGSSLEAAEDKARNIIAGLKEG